MSTKEMKELGDKFAGMTTGGLIAERTRIVSEYRTQREWAADGCTTSAAGAFACAHHIDAINHELRRRCNAQTPDKQA